MRFTRPLSFVLAALVSFGAAAQAPKKPAKKSAPKLDSGPGWKVTENKARFPELQLYGGVGAGLPGLVWGTAGLETHQIFPFLYTDFTLRFSPNVFLGDLESIPYTQPLSAWGRARLGVTWPTSPRASVDFETGYEKVGNARVSKIYHMGIPGDIIEGKPGRDHEASWGQATLNFVLNPVSCLVGAYVGRLLAYLTPGGGGV